MSPNMDDDDFERLYAEEAAGLFSVNRVGFRQNFHRRSCGSGLSLLLLHSAPRQLLLGKASVLYRGSPAVASAVTLSALSQTSAAT